MAKNTMGRAVSVGGAPVMAVLTIIDPVNEVDEHLVVIQDADGTATAGILYRLRDADELDVECKVFAGGSPGRNRIEAIGYLLETGGYGRLEIPA